MRRIPVLAVTGLLIVLAVLLPAGSAEASAQGDAITKLNQIRQANGLSQLRTSDSLRRSSTRYARHMIQTDYFGHPARIGVSGRFARAGETLALHAGWSANPSGTVDDWMSSPAHRAVLLASNFRFVGMGIARGRLGSRSVTVWVAHLGAPR